MGEIHAVSEGAEVVVEEPGVDAEGHRCGGVTEHPLDRLDVRAAGDQQRSVEVPQVVGPEPVGNPSTPTRAALTARSSTHGPSCHPDSPRLAGEDVFGMEPAHMCGDGVCQAASAAPL